MRITRTAGIGRWITAGRCDKGTAVIDKTRTRVRYSFDKTHAKDSSKLTLLDI